MGKFKQDNNFRILKLCRHCKKAFQDSGVWFCKKEKRHPLPYFGLLTTCDAWKERKPDE